MRDCDIIFPDGHSQHEGVLGVPLGQDLPSPRQRYDWRKGGRAHILAGKLEGERVTELASGSEMNMGNSETPYSL